jgi:DNA-binding transcriptional regulator YdaS (Cro superfamily)
MRTPERSFTRKGESVQHGETNNVTTVRERWGDAAPEWIVVLAEACNQQSQTKVGKLLGVSPTVINQALRNVYPSPLTKLEQKVRGELMRETVRCPVLGEITKRRCLDEQNRPYAATNPVRVELRRACARCPNSISKEPR